ncbi:MAG: TipAS antibiotic-recognition domain-containing protein [Candidatus Saccharicenans sp.]
MTENKNNNWAADFFTPEELEEFARLGEKFSFKEMAEYQKKWFELIEEVKHNLGLSPDSPEAQNLLQRWEDLLNQGYRGHEKLLEKVARAYQEAAVPAEYNLIDDQVWEFIKKARAARKENP